MPGAGEPLQEIERELPTPDPGEALVRVGGSSLNYHDQVNLLGLISGPWPRSPMSDGAGEVVAVGAGVRTLGTGHRVLSTFHPEWREGPATPASKRMLPGDTTDGWLKQYVCAAAEALVPAPEHLSDPEASTLVCAGTTAWTALQAGGVGAGSTVVAQGTGGVSIFVLQLAKALGAHVILTSSSDAKLEVGRTLGADEVINYRTTPDWGKEVRRLTGGRGADVIVDIGGGSTLEQSCRAAAMNGTVSVVGGLGGFGNAEVPVSQLFLNNLRLIGISVGSVADHAALSEFVSKHKIVPYVSHTFDWDQVPEAVRVAQANEHIGKIAFRIP
jgi:NADPH:quinone reductase-like Zn-dependent oxidoreductase